MPHVRRLVFKLDARILLLAAALSAMMLFGARPALACDDRVPGACKGYTITPAADASPAVGLPQTTSARRSRRGFSRRGFSRRGYTQRSSRRASRGAFRMSRAERRRARQEAREARETRDETPEAPMVVRSVPRAGPGRAAIPGLPGLRGDESGVLLFLPNVPKIGSSFVPAKPMVVDSPAAISAVPLPDDAGAALSDAQRPSARAAAEPMAAAPMTPPAGPAPTLTAEQRAAVAQAMTGGPALASPAIAAPAGNTGTLTAHPAGAEAPVATVATPSPPENSSMLRYAILALAGVLALGTVVRLAMT